MLATMVHSVKTMTAMPRYLTFKMAQYAVVTVHVSLQMRANALRDIPATIAAYQSAMDYLVTLHWFAIHVMVPVWHLTLVSAIRTILARSAKYLYALVMLQILQPLVLAKVLALKTIPVHATVATMALNVNYMIALALYLIPRQSALVTVPVPHLILAHAQQVLVGQHKIAVYQFAMVFWVIVHKCAII